MTDSPVRPVTEAVLDPAAEAVLGPAAEAAPYPVVVVDAAGLPVRLNGAAAALLPGARHGERLAAPRWLADALADPERRPSGGPLDGRSFAAHPSTLSAGRAAWWLVDETALRTAVDELDTERSRTRFLTEASSRLLASLNLERCMGVTARLAVEHLADAAVVIAPSARRSLPVISSDGGEPTARTLRASRLHGVPGLSEALTGFPPVPSRWIDPATLPPWLPPEGFGTVGSVVIVPLPGHGVPGGALVLLRHAEPAAFTESEEHLAGLFAARAGSAMSAARLYAEQNSISDTLMRELLPPRLTDVAGVGFAGGYRPSADTERVGGDFYDVHPGDGAGSDTFAVLGDVCGKGLEAAVLTGKIRNTLHALRPLADDHVRVLHLLNNALLTGDSTRFATLVLASARRTPEGVRLRLTAAGHAPPLIVRRDGTVEEADTRGSLIGVLPEVTARTAHVTLAPGETCLLYTDGITDARGGPLGGEMYGEERLRRALGECAGLPAEAVVERVQMLAGQWAGAEPHDDMAVVAVTAPRGGHRAAGHAAADAPSPRRDGGA